jgi:transcription initiation factor TFIID subunit 1
LLITISVLADDDDEEDYEEPGGGNGFLSFMFGNVDDSGDLDADYLDQVNSCLFYFLFF